MNASQKLDNVESLAARRNKQVMAETAKKSLSVTPAQRAAVVIALLGDKVAKPIVEKLDDVALAKVAEELENISMLTREELIEIIVDFIGNLRKMSGAMRGGRENARAVLSGVLEPQRFDQVFGEELPQLDFSFIEEDSIWNRMEKRDPQQIADYLSRLSPNLIALILQKFDVSVASEVLSRMDGEKLGPMIGHMVQNKKLDPGVDQVLERMVEIEFMNVVAEEERDEGESLASVGELLSLIPSDKRRSLIDFLRTEHEEKLPLVEKSIFTIEGLPSMLPKVAVPVVFRELEQSVLLKLLNSLQGSNQAVADFLLESISSRMADQYRDDLSNRLRCRLKRLTRSSGNSSAR
jgi:flagellar motor switch protein FliG